MRVTPLTAFSKDPRTGSLARKPRIKVSEHLKWVKSLPCVITGATPCDPAHISYGDPCYGKPGRGLGEKASDKWVVPLCREQHDKQEFQMNEILFWKQAGIDPCRVAAALWASSGDDEAGRLIISHAKSMSRTDEGPF